MDERGASAVEYGLLIAGIAALIVVVVFAFGGVLNRVFHEHLWLRQQPGQVRRHLLTSAPLTMAADLRSAAICISRGIRHVQARLSCRPGSWSRGVIHTPRWKGPA